MPKPLTFSLAGEPLVVVPDAPDTALETFGPEYGQTITIRWPTIGDEIRIDAQITAYCERLNVRDQGGLGVGTYQLVRSLMFFGVLAEGDLPPWLSAEAESRDMTAAAIIRAYDVARRLLTEEKKSSEAAGAS